MSRRLAPLTVLALAFLALPAHAGPLELAAQGRLSSAGGPVADGSYPMGISLYDQQAGGTELFKELFLGIPVQGGVFALTIGGGTTKLDSALFAPNKGELAQVRQELEWHPERHRARFLL